MQEHVDPKILYNKPALPPAVKVCDRIAEIVDSGWVSNGVYSTALEDAICEIYAVKHALTCTNATQGLIISMKAAGWRNKRILAPAFTWPSTIYAIECNIGNKVVFGDIDRKTWHLDMATAVDEYDAIIGMDTFGNESSISPDGKPLIYDAAHGFGLGGIGHRPAIAEVISLSFTKIVTGMEGGLILTNDTSFHEVAKEIRRLSSRMPEINALMALESIKMWQSDGCVNRKQHVDFYVNNLDFKFERQHVPIGTNHSVFSILLPSQFIRDSIVDAFKKNHIEPKVYYEPLVEGLPVTDLVYSRILSLPVYASLTEDEQKKICEVANQAAKAFTPGKNYLKNSGYLDNYIRRES